jgi:diguanylate cyclase (GGDEF)-like protein
MSIKDVVSAVGQRRWWCVTLICAAVTGLFALVMVFNPLGLGVTVWIDDIGEGVAAALGAVACGYAASSKAGLLRLSWYLLAAASASWAIGEGVWCWYQLVANVEVPFPSLADLFFLLAVPLMVAGVLFLAEASGAVTRSMRSLLDGAIIACSLLFVSWATALGTVWSSGGEGLFARIVGLAYPLGDVVTATVALTSLARAKGTGRRQLGLLAAGVVSLAVSDSMFAYLTGNGTYGNGNWMDTGWVAGFLIIGLAALSPSRPGTAEPVQKGQSTAQLVVPYVPVFFAGAIAAVREATGHSIGVVLFAIGATTTTLVMARQLQALVDNRRLNRRLESTVTELEAREVDLARQAFHDPLTGLVNRVLFADRLHHALERQKRDQGTLAVMIVDLDDFKSVNDTLGHLAGDELLKQVATRLQASVRQADTIARIGGDEFALLLENVIATEDAVRAVERVGHMLRTPLNIGGGEVKASASVGIVLAPGPGPTGDELLRDADIALYEAKYNGKSCYRIFESKMLEGVVSRMQLKSELGSLGSHLGQLTLHYQPILSARTGRMTGVEALMRWQHPTRGLLYPTSFIEFAEETGAIVMVGAAAMDMACAQAAAWRDLGIACPTISVNLSARQLHDPGVVEMVSRSLAKYSLPPADLTIEITESITMKDADQAVERLRRLKDLGVSIAIDDFGTGWSSLSYLRRLPVDFVKFDRSFTADVASDQDAATLIKLMNNLAHALGLETVAEGIETAAQLNAVRRLGCDHVQGFHLARPAPASAVTELIREHRTHTREPHLAEAFVSPAS